MTTGQYNCVGLMTIAGWNRDCVSCWWTVPSPGSFFKDSPDVVVSSPILEVFHAHGEKTSWSLMIHSVVGNDHLTSTNLFIEVSLCYVGGGVVIEEGSIQVRLVVNPMDVRRGLIDTSLKVLPLTSGPGVIYTTASGFPYEVVKDFHGPMSAYCSITFTPAASQH